jgi:hypothetical protein
MCAPRAARPNALSTGILSNILLVTHRWDEMMKGEVELDRYRLYDLIWSEPISRLAERFGYSTLASRSCAKS